MRLYIHKKLHCTNLKKNRKDFLVNGVGEIEANFKYVKSKINEDKFPQRIR